MAYIRFPIEVSPSTLAQEVFDYIQANAPNWSPQDGNLDVWIIRAICQLASENRAIASDVQDDIFRYFGASLMGVQPLDAISAQANTTWTLNDSLGHTIAGGTLVAIPDSSGDLQTFYVLNDIVVPNGNSATSAGAVVITAVTAGADASGLGAPATQIQLIDVLDWVTSVVMTNTTFGGQDAEDDSTYLSRLSRVLQRLSRRPILPADFAAAALDVDPSVVRAVALDGYNTADSTYDNERMVTIAAVDASGAAVTSGVKNEIKSYLEANREVNFVVNVMDPTYTTVNIAVTIVVQAGYDSTSVNSSVTSAVTAYLNPANWGQDPAVTEGTASDTWIETGTVYLNEMITVVSNVLGVARVTALTINGSAADLTLSGPASLTHVGTIGVTDA